LFALAALRQSAADGKPDEVAGFFVVGKVVDAHAANLEIVLMLTLKTFATSRVFSPLAMRWRASLIW
jgi:hypothetical protein